MARTILIVDEDAQFTSRLAESLRGYGCEVRVASTFRDAVHTFAQLRPALLITGLQLGAYNGLHLLVRGRADHPGMAAIVVGPDDPGVEREARALGAAAYFPRSVALPDLVAETRKLPAFTEDGDEGRSSSAMVLPTLS